MDSKTKLILPLATALAALTTSAELAAASVPHDPSSATSQPKEGNRAAVTPNATFIAGADLLGMKMTRNSGGLVAEHASHMSHASHASHASSRY